MQKPLVSIITPLYDCAKYIEDTYNSIIAQTYTNWEWIVIDDKSTDNSLEIVQKLSKDNPKIKIFENEQNMGGGKTRNRAIGLAAGTMIAFLDGDDVWHPNKLEKQLKFMQDNDAALSHTSYGYIDEDSKEIKSTFRVSRIPVSYHDLLKRTEIGCLTGMYNAEKLGKRYMSEHRRKQDYALWLSILRTGVKSYGLDEKLGSYRQRAGSATSTKSKLILKHFFFLKETQNMNSIKALYYTSYWAINGFIRYYIK